MCETNNEKIINIRKKSSYMIKFISHNAVEPLKCQKKVKLTIEEVLLMISLGYCCFTGYACFSLLAPFYPRVAENKGLSTTQYGFVFACYEIVRFFLSPISGVVAIRMTPKVFLMNGILTSSLCTIVFGILIYEQDSFKFFWLSIIIRVFWAFGGTACITGTYLISSLLLENHISQAYAAIETSIGLGYMFGPWFGGYLFELGGFSLPFYVMFCLSLFSLIPIYFLINNELKPQVKNEKTKQTTVLEAMKSSGININLLLNVLTSLLCSFNEATLDYHLREFGEFTPSQTGLIFLLSSLAYSISSQTFGWYAKKYPTSYWTSIYFGMFFLFLCFILNGPIYGLPFGPNIYLIILAQIFLGIGAGNVFLISFNELFHIAKINLPDNDSTVAILSGLCSSAYALGNSIGPAFGGYSLKEIGYREVTIGINILIILMTFVLAYYTMKIKKKTVSVFFS